jgi:hypothetical protein
LQGFEEERCVFIVGACCSPIVSIAAIRELRCHARRYSLWRAWNPRKQSRGTTFTRAFFLYDRRESGLYAAPDTCNWSLPLLHRASKHIGDRKYFPVCRKTRGRHVPDVGGDVDSASRVGVASSRLRLYIPRRQHVIQHATEISE